MQTGDMVGLPLSRIDLVNFLMSRFPDADIVDVRETSENQEATIVVKHDLDEQAQSKIMSFVYNLSLPVAFKIAVSSDQQTDATKINGRSHVHLGFRVTPKCTVFC